MLNPFDMKLSKGLASFQSPAPVQRQTSLPVPIGAASALAAERVAWRRQTVGGWQWSGALNIQSGSRSRLRLVRIAPQRDTLISRTCQPDPDFKGPVILGKVGQWFDPALSCYRLPGLSGTWRAAPLLGRILES